MSFFDFKISKNDDIAKYYLLTESTIGKGTYGSVRKAIQLESKGLVALKIIKKKKNIELIANEIQVLKKVQNHPNIIKFNESFDSPDHVYLSFELCSGGNLQDFVSSNRLTFIDEDVKTIIKKLSSCIEYIHNQNVIHRDIKAENIMIVNSKISWDIRLIDFGLSVFNQKGFAKSICGTPIYEAPEISSRKEYTQSCDTWSLGILTILLSEKFDATSIALIGKMVERKQYDLINMAFASVRSQPLLADFVGAVLKTDPMKRIHTKQITRHEWLGVHNSTRYTTVDLLRTFKIQDLWRKAIVFSTVVARFTIRAKVKKNNSLFDSNSNSNSLSQSKSGIGLQDLKIRSYGLSLNRSRTNLQQ